MSCDTMGVSAFQTRLSSSFSLLCCCFCMRRTFLERRFFAPQDKSLGGDAMKWAREHPEGRTESEKQGGLKRKENAEKL